MSYLYQPQQEITRLRDEVERWDNEGGALAQMSFETNMPIHLQRFILQRLGLAVVVGWNGFPKQVQKILFSTASSQGKRWNRHKLTEQIARFLHQHKNDSQAIELLTESRVEKLAD